MACYLLFMLRTEPTCECCGMPEYEENNGQRTFSAFTDEQLCLCGACIAHFSTPEGKAAFKQFLALPTPSANFLNSR
jgi:hypothetical protein